MLNFDKALKVIFFQKKLIENFWSRYNSHIMSGDMFKKTVHKTDQSDLGV